jgi:hypothetical protein
VPRRDERLNRHAVPREKGPGTEPEHSRDQQHQASEQPSPDWCREIRRAKRFRRSWIEWELGLEGAWVADEPPAPEEQVRNPPHGQEDRNGSACNHHGINIQERKVVIYGPDGEPLRVVTLDDPEPDGAGEL